MARNLDGKSSKQYRVVKKSFGSVVSGVQFGLPVLTNELFSRDCISEIEYSKAINSGHSAYERASLVVMSMLTKIESDSSYYDKFIVALNHSDLGDVANLLECSLDSEVSCPSTYPNVTVGPSTSSTQLGSQLKCLRLNNSVADKDLDSLQIPCGDFLDANDDIDFTAQVHSLIRSHKITALPSSLRLCMPSVMEGFFHSPLDESQLVESISTHHKEVVAFEKFIKLIFMSLQPSDFSAFVQYTREARLVPQEIKNQLDIMHPIVPHEKKCRYLLLHIWLELKYSDKLDREKGLLGLCRVLNRFSTLAHIGQLIVNETETGMNSEECKVKEYLLDFESHYSHLSTLLSEYSHLWQNIGFALQFSADSLSEINSNEKKNSACFQELLDAWLSRKFEHTLLPTLSNLRRALLSPSVNLGKKFGMIRKSLINTSPFKEQDEKCIENVKSFVSSDICIEEPFQECTVILEVDVKTNKQNVLYQWSKNDRAQVGETLSMICVHIRDITSEGKYLCNFGAPSSWSDPVMIHVKTLLDKYKSYLTSRYSAQPEVMPDTWPCISQKSFVNLALINDTVGSISNEYCQQTIRGDADDVFASKNSITFQEAFRTITYGDRVLVIGRPGSGKTTLVLRFCQEWANGLTLTGVRCLFFISLRNFRSNPSIGLKQLVSCYFDNEEDCSIVCEYIEKHQGLGVCFILDGLDEYQPQMIEKTYIYKLITVLTLPRAVIIVASRPAAVAMCRSSFVKCIEVLGFFKKQIQEYIDSYKFKSKVECSAIKKYLIHHPAMICFLYDVSGDALPSMETMIYYEFTKHTILRALYRNTRVSLKMLDCLQGSVREIFGSICKLAFEKMRNSEQVLEQEDFGGLLNEGVIKESLGLITVDWIASLSGFQNVYSFCHLTFQEFLAAYYISRLAADDQLAIIHSCGAMQHMYIIIKFYCGLTKFDEDCGRFKAILEVSKFKALHKLHCCFESQQPATCELVVDKNMVAVDESFRTPSDYTCLGYVVVNARKNQVKMLEFHVDATFNEECVEAFIKVLGKHRMVSLSPVEMFSVINAHDVRPESLFFEMLRAFSSLRSVYCQFLSSSHIISLLNQSFPSLELISCHDFTIQDDQISELEQKFKNVFPNLQKDALLHTGKSYTATHEDLLLRSFPVYCKNYCSFTNYSIRRGEALKISYDLRANYQCMIHRMEGNSVMTHTQCLCTHLYMFNCDITDETAALLANGLKYNSSILVLKIIANKIGDDGAVAVANSLKCCSSIIWLDMCLNNIGDKGAKFLFDSVKGKSNFYLRLFGNNISDNLTTSLCSQSDFKQLQILDIGECIEDRGLAHMDYMLKQYTPPFSIVNTLRTVYLKSCCNTPEGIRSIKNILSRWNTIQSVSLIDMNLNNDSLNLIIESLYNANADYTHLMPDTRPETNAFSQKDVLEAVGEESHMDLLKNCVQLQKLTLASNSIGNLGAEVLAKFMKSCKNLNTLDLSDNRIGDGGVMALAESLKQCLCLQKLHLDHNFIRNDGAESLAISLIACSQLTSLNLRFNNIGSLGIQWLKSLRIHCPKLCSLQF